MVILVSRTSIVLVIVILHFILYIAIVVSISSVISERLRWLRWISRRFRNVIVRIIKPIVRGIPVIVTISCIVHSSWRKRSVCLVVVIVRIRFTIRVVRWIIPITICFTIVLSVKRPKNKNHKKNVYNIKHEQQIVLPSTFICVWTIQTSVVPTMTSDSKLSVVRQVCQLLFSWCCWSVSGFS